MCGFLIILLTFLLAGVLYLWLAFYEPKGLPLASLQARIFIPEEIRNLKFIGGCGQVTVDLSYQECTAGICGEVYWLNFETTSLATQYQKSLKAQLDKMSLPPTDSQFIESDGTGLCKRVTATLYFKY